MHRDGERLIIESLCKRGWLALLNPMKPFREEYPEISDPPLKRERMI